MALSNMDGNSKDRGLLYYPFYRQAGNALAVPYLDWLLRKDGLPAPYLNWQLKKELFTRHCPALTFLSQF